MLEIICLLFVVFVLLGIGLIDSRLNKLVNIRRQVLIDTREVADHLKVLCGSYEAQLKSHEAQLKRPRM